MGITEELAADKQAHGRHTCILCKWLKRQSPEERAEWQAALMKRSGAAYVWPHSTIERVLRQHGFKGTDDVIARHRSNNHVVG
jgi:hypothetical protein